MANLHALNFLICSWINIAVHIASLQAVSDENWRFQMRGSLLFPCPDFLLNLEAGKGAPVIQAPNIPVQLRCLRAICKKCILAAAV